MKHEVLRDALLSDIPYGWDNPEPLSTTRKGWKQNESKFEKTQRNNRKKKNKLAKKARRRNRRKK